MPAVHLARLKEQITRLAWNFTRPDEFQKGLRDLMDSYADHSYRAGQAVKARPLITAYHIPPLVLRQLEQDLSRLCRENPGAALTLVDRLWQEEYLEPRLLAAYLLGQVSPTPPEPVLERLLAWADPNLDVQILNALMSQGSARLRRGQPERWLVMVEHWLSDMSLDMQSLGLSGLLPVIQDREFENLPRIYRLLAPLVQTAPNPLQAELQQAIEALARRSPVETAYFLRQMLSMAEGVTPIRLVRRCLPAFPEETQAGLRKAILSRPNRGSEQRLSED